MACSMLKRPCRLNFDSLGMDCAMSNSLPNSSTSRGSATPAARRCEKRSSPEAHTPHHNQRQSPNAISPAADVFLMDQKRMFSTDSSLTQQQQTPQQVCAKRMRKCGGRSRRRGLSVSFSGCSKRHDGLRPSTFLLDELVFAYFESHKISCAEDVQRLLTEQFGGCPEYRSFKVLEEVHEQLTALCERCANLDVFGSMPVLLQGGGRGMQLQCNHHYHLCQLTQMFECFKAHALEQ